jgi:hypothetical protein
MDPRNDSMKEIARHIFDHALRESSIQHAFARHVSCDRGVLRICEDLYDLNAYDRVFVIAVGKACMSRQASDLKASLRARSSLNFIFAAFDISRADIRCRTQNPFAAPTRC